MNLKVERAKRNWTQEKLANEAGICRLTVSNIERNGFGNMQVNVLRKISKALDVTIDELLKEE